MSKGLKYSLILHFIVFLLAFFGLPTLFHKKEPEPMMFSVEVLPITSESNVKPKKTQAPEQAKVEQPQQKPAEISPPPKPKSEEKVVEPKKEPFPEPQKEIIKKEPEKKQPEKKEEEAKKKKPDDNKDKKKKKDELEDVEALLKTLDKAKSKKSDKPKEKKPTPKVSDELLDEWNDQSDGQYNNSKPLSMSEKDAVRNQIYKCWNVPVGTKDAQNVKVVILLKLEADGSLKDTKILTSDSSDGGNKVAFRVVAESAIRAIHRCSPLQNLPAAKYDSWKELELSFDPSELIY
jgi:outer membrane biosynthesis protein TonB